MTDNKMTEVLEDTQEEKLKVMFTALNDKVSTLSDQILEESAIEMDIALWGSYLITCINSSDLNTENLKLTIYPEMKGLVFSYPLHGSSLHKANRLSAFIESCFNKDLSEIIEILEENEELDEDDDFIQTAEENDKLYVMFHAFAEPVLSLGEEISDECPDIIMEGINWIIFIKHCLAKDNPALLEDLNFNYKRNYFIGHYPNTEENKTKTAILGTFIYILLDDREKVMDIALNSNIPWYEREPIF